MNVGSGEIRNFIGDTWVGDLGIENMSFPELEQWLSICIRNEQNTKFNKGRRSWKQGKEEVEARFRNNVMWPRY